VAGAELRGRLQKLGIYRESRHEHFNGVVIPIFDPNSHVAQMYGRKITLALREGTAASGLPTRPASRNGKASKDVEYGHDHGAGDPHVHH